MQMWCVVVLSIAGFSEPETLNALCFLSLFQFVLLRVVRTRVVVF